MTDRRRRNAILRRNSRRRNAILRNMRRRDFRRSIARNITPLDVLILSSGLPGILALLYLLATGF